MKMIPEFDLCSQGGGRFSQGAGPGLAQRLPRGRRGDRRDSVNLLQGRVALFGSGPSGGPMMKFLVAGHAHENSPEPEILIARFCDVEIVLIHKK